jgi:hypothetical protein
MANWLQKIFPPASNNQGGRNLPAKRQDSPLQTLLTPITGGQTLPNATLIYGIAAGVLFGVALFFLFSGRWFTGFLVLLPAGCFLGFALQFIKAR